MKGPEPSETGNVAKPEVESGIVRQMMLEPWLLVSSLLLLAVCVVAALGLPKMWLTTPPWFRPNIRVSWLDQLQSRSLAVTARRHDAAGRIDDAVQAWRGAHLNDMGDADNCRGLLRTVIRLDDPSRKHMGFGAQQGFWLLRLAGTNIADVGLLALLFEKYALDESAVSLLHEHRDRLGDPEKATLLRTAFRLGRMDLFGSVWAEAPGTFAADPELRVYRAAWAAGWGPASGISAGKEELARATADPELARAAHVASLTLATARQDPAAYARSLEYLVDRHFDTPGHHAGYWSLLVQAGRTEEAKELAHRHTTAPQTPHELSRIADVLASLDLDDDAITLIQRYLPAFSYQSLLWAQLADLLARRERWTELRTLGVELRTDPQQRVDMPGYGWFLEGLGSLKSHLPQQAELCFKEMSESHIADPLIGYRSAALLQEIGRPEHAARLLAALERDFGGVAEYWFRVGFAAYQNDDIRLMLLANEKAVTLQPENQAAVNNLSAALLLLREQPARCAELTVRRLAANPRDPAARINHTLALVLNRRTREAAALLAEFDLDLLPSLEASVLRYAQFEIAVIDGKHPEARAAFPKIDRRFLRSAQLEWLYKAAADLGISISKP